MGTYASIDFTPPEAARKAAAQALAVRATKPPSERGMTKTGLSRARDLVNGRTLSPRTVERMVSFFQRHEVDKQGETWGDKGKGWQAWHGWGGDAGYAWARKVLKQMNTAEESAYQTGGVALLEHLATTLDEATPAFLKRCVRAVAADKGGGRDGVSAAFAICTAQAQRDGRLEPGTQTPTAAGKKSTRSKAAQKGHAGKLRDYEDALRSARKPA